MRESSSVPHRNRSSATDSAGLVIALRSAVVDKASHASNVLKVEPGGFRVFMKTSSSPIEHRLTVFAVMPGLYEGNAPQASVHRVRQG